MRTWIAVMAVERALRTFALAAVATSVGCSETRPPLAPHGEGSAPAPYYLIGPGDTLNLFVWRNEDLSKTLKVRPDGRISVPLIDDIEAAGKTPTRLAREIESELSAFLVDPIATVMVVDFSGTFAQQIRVIGEAQKPQAIPYRDKMTVLDVMIAVGGLTEFASGNRAVVSRTTEGEQKQYRVRLDDLIRDGDISANVEMSPGDVLIIPQRYI